MCKRLYSFLGITLLLEVCFVFGGYYPTNNVHEAAIDAISTYNPDLRIAELKAIREKFNVADSDFHCSLLIFRPN